MDKFQNRLRMALDQEGMKPIDLAKKMDISRGTISQYLSGVCKPKTDRIYQMSQILHVSPAWLMGFDEPDYRITDDAIIEKVNSLSHSSREMLMEYLEFLTMREKEVKDVQG